MIPYGRQHITDEDIAEVVAVLKSDFITQGPAVERFEQSVASFCGAAMAVAVSNATAGLHIAYQALGVGLGDLVWTVPNTFAATANAARYLGADVDFVDIDIATRNMSADALEAKFEAAEAAGRLPKLVVPVHFAGLSCDMVSISALCRKYGALIVEDASHAIGGSYKGRPIGNCQFSAATIFSFHPVKIITTGEGGMVTTADKALGERIAMLRSHGITRDPKRMGADVDGPWFYEMLELGFNYRLTDIQSALGASQMARLESYIETRNEIANAYNTDLADGGLGLPDRSPDCVSAFHLYSIHWPAGLGGIDRRQAVDALRQKGIGVNVHYIPVHTLSYYRGLGFRAGSFPNAEAHYAQAISLPMFATLTENERGFVVKSLRDLAGK
jgi:UDP-4-amino-4,6-dideoxy-N-acetyl-beta-L-altrosamine transaminase